MQRRLYFLFPDEQHAQRACKTLIGADVAASGIHALQRDSAGLRQLPAATPNQARDLLRRLEAWFWNGNLLLFAVALLAAVLAVWQAAWVVALIAAAVMLASFLLGERATHLPNVHLDQLADALRHGEVLLMVDVPVGRVAEIEGLITHRHPEAADGGVSWSIAAFGA